MWRKVIAHRIVARFRIRALVLATALMVPSAVVVLTPSAADASTASSPVSNPLGPTIAELEALTAQLAGNTQALLEGLGNELQYELFGYGGIGSEIYCLVYIYVEGNPTPCNIGA